MENTGLALVRRLMDEGFFHDNLHKMAESCRQEMDTEKLLASYVIQKVFYDLAEEIGEGPVMTSELRKLEAKYRTTINLSLEKAISGSPARDQESHLTKLIRTHWNL
jgi:hypothetical protein